MTVKASKLGPGLLTIGETGTPQEFGSQVTEVTLEPSFDEGDAIPVLSGEEVPGDTKETYTLKGKLLQDYSGMESLLVFCKENNGAVLPFVFVPDKTGGLSATGSIVMRPVPFGGTVKEQNTADFEWQGVGDWAFAAYTPAGG